MAASLSIKAPGRVCFFGDHQDYLGLPVIAATIDRYVFIEATPIDTSFLRIDLLDFSRQETIALNETIDRLAPRDYFRSALRVLAREGIAINNGYHIRIWGDIPIQAGLSSSSASVVAWIRLLLKIAAPERHFTNEQIAHWSYATEVLEFNEPGGLMDQYTIALGGLLCIDTRTGDYLRLNTAWEQVVIVDSGIEKNTLNVLSHLKTNALKALAMVKEKHPSFVLEQATAEDYHLTAKEVPKDLLPYWSAAIHNHLITQQALEEFTAVNTDLSRISELMNAHQNILQNDLKNTPPEMVEMMQCAQKNGAMGAKIVGSGGGGCFVALTSKAKEAHLIDALKQMGVKDAFSVTMIPPQHG